MAAIVDGKEAGCKPVKGRRGLKALQKELLDVKSRYKDAVKVLTSKQKEGSTGAGPWPIVVKKTSLPTRDAETFDVTSISLKLCIDAKFDPDHPEKLPVHVESPPSSELPTVLSQKIAETVEEKWKADLLAKGSGEGWLLAPMISWIDKNYLKLIRLMPELIEHYIGCDSEGCSQRRFTIVAPTEVAKEVESDNSDGIDEEEAARAAEYYAQIELERQRKAEEDAKKKKAEGARIRAMYEDGKLHAAPPKLSKKEEAEKRKKKQGVRTAKTAPRPYDGEGAKERRKGKTKS